MKKLKRLALVAVAAVVLSTTACEQTKHFLFPQTSTNAPAGTPLVNPGVETGVRSVGGAFGPLGEAVAGIVLIGLGAAARHFAVKKKE